MLCANTPLKWAFNEKMIPANPVIGLTKFSITNKERGILTEQEAAAVFNTTWKDKRAYVASLVAATTGARQGECLALRRSDIGEDTITIAHGFSLLDGLKCPKNGNKRVVPLLPGVRTALLDLLNDNPHEVSNPFIFFSLYPDRPVTPNVVLGGLKDAMKTVNSEYLEMAQKAKLEKPEIQIDYKGRNISFHSWRHWFCSKVTEKIEGEKVAKISGHISEKVFKKYASHIEAKNIQDVGDVVKQVFETVINFQAREVS